MIAEMIFIIENTVKNEQDNSRFLIFQMEKLR